MKKFGLIVAAFVVWLLAIIGAIAVALWLRLTLEQTRALVILVAFIAFFGAFVPIARWRGNRKS
jgi:hypothetical protein